MKLLIIALSALLQVNADPNPSDLSLWYPRFGSYGFSNYNGRSGNGLGGNNGRSGNVGFGASREPIDNLGTGYDLPMFGYDLPMFGYDLPMFGYDLPMFGYDLIWA
eukprot:GHVR01123248.1.p1 GENE.GHVR01123248.1~~GHVR01123248.1.p1  ORF type:complete len:117 (+),score=12.78 GHVR01123248.1:34-351(+)